MSKQIKLILPTNRMGVVLDLKRGERLYFLLGPIRGGGDWQAEAIRLLHEKDPNCYIACPCRYDVRHSLSKYEIKPTIIPHDDESEEKTPEYALPFENQTMWERYYLKLASWHGSIVCWLPNEDKKNPRPKEQGPYAQDTYGELGRWSIMSSDPQRFSIDEDSKGRRINLTIGAEENFPGLSVIQKNFNADHGKDFPIHSTLEETILAAVKLGKKTNPQPMNFND